MIWWWFDVLTIQIWCTSMWWFDVLRWFDVLTIQIWCTSMWWFDVLRWFDVLTIQISTFVLFESVGILFEGAFRCEYN